MGFAYYLFQSEEKPPVHDLFVDKEVIIRPTEKGDGFDVTREYDATDTLIALEDLDDVKGEESDLENGSRGNGDHALRHISHSVSVEDGDVTRSDVSRVEGAAKNNEGNGKPENNEN
jgi:hypothetical protein